MPNLYLLFSERNAAASEAALAGARQAFGEVRSVPAGGVDEVLLQRPQDALLVFIEPRLEEVELQFRAAPEEGLPRWPAVTLSSSLHSSALAVIPPEDWHVPLLAQVFRAAVQQHALQRENARLRGDVLTIARRISHDLRTPLSGVFTTAELLKEILAEHSEEDAALTASLFDSTQTVLKLIERVSQVAKASVELRLNEEVDMGQAAWAGRQSVERLAMDGGIKIQEPSDWPQVQGVAAWLETVWANLLQQAVQRSRRGTAVVLDWQETADGYEFSVTDGGPEMKEEQREALLLPFEKLHQSRTARGLELPIARRFVELQGGRCRIETTEAGGLKYIFELPKAEAATEAVA
ncbi:MAG TPA: HAMP domain-containing sensor histidine kinase [Prosthecobacter sp.]